MQRSHTRQDRPEGGFTLLEIMVVVVIIAILAAVVVPSWMREARNGKYDPEVRAMFTELAAKEEAWRTESGNGMYHNTKLSGSYQCPSSPQPDGVSFTNTCVYAGAGSQDFQDLRVQETDSQIRCQYEIHDGCAGVADTNCPSTIQSTAADSGALGLPTVPFGTAAPATLLGPWYYIVATCNMDNDTSTGPSQFLTESWDTSIQKQNYGL